MNNTRVVQKSEFFYTDNLKLGAALVTAGYKLRTEIRDGKEITVGLDCVIIGGKEVVTFELEPNHNGIKAIWFLGAFENKFDLSEKVDEIIAKYGITPEDQTILAFDGARTGLQNGSYLMYAGRNNEPVESKEIGGGRMLVYRRGTPRDQLKKLIDHA